MRPGSTEAETPAARRKSSTARRDDSSAGFSCEEARVMENPRRMNELACLGAHAQQQVMVLDEIDLTAETTNFVAQRAAEHHEMADVVFAQDQIGRPIGLEKGLGAQAGFVQVVLV